MDRDADGHFQILSRDMKTRLLWKGHMDGEGIAPVLPSGKALIVQARTLVLIGVLSCVGIKHQIPPSQYDE